MVSRETPDTVELTPEFVSEWHRLTALNAVRECSGCHKPLGLEVWRHYVCVMNRSYEGKP